MRKITHEFRKLLINTQLISALRFPHFSKFVWIWLHYCWWRYLLRFCRRWPTSPWISTHLHMSLCPLHGTYHLSITLRIHPHWGNNSGQNLIYCLLQNCPRISNRWCTHQYPIHSSYQTCTTPHVCYLTYRCSYLPHLPPRKPTCLHMCHFPWSSRGLARGELT